MTSTRAWFAGVLVVLVGVGAPRAQPVAPTVPVWPGHVEGGAVRVDAVDVDADVLRSALAPAGASYVTTPAGKTITGRVQVARRADAMAALVAREPALAIAPLAIRGRGAKVDLDFSAASTRELYRVLAAVLRTNIVVLVPSTDLTIRVKRQPADGVLAEVARASGAAIDRPVPNLVVVRAASAPPSQLGVTVGGLGLGGARARPRGAKLRLATRELLAGHLVELIRALDGPSSPVDALRDGALACLAGQRVELRLDKVATDTALAIVAEMGGVSLRGPRCALPPLPHDPVDLKLVATVARGGTRLAAVEVAGAAYLVAHGGAWEVGDAWIAHRGAQGERQWRLYPGPLGKPSPGAPASGVRLAATVIDGRARVAIVETGGGFRIWTAGRPVVTDDGERLDVTVAPGEVEVRGGATLRLSPRAP